MPGTLKATCWIVLSGCLAIGSPAALLMAHSSVGMASFSTWYWQNPLPRAYSVSAVACRSVTACVAVGANGNIVTTDDGGKHWTNRVSGTNADLVGVSCPGRAICYALGARVTKLGPTGQPESAETMILKSGDGGRTWRQQSSQLSTGPFQRLTDLACPGVTTCLYGAWDYLRHAGTSILRTADGGGTWRVVNVPGLYGTTVITCASVSICYLIGFGNSGSRLLQSVNGGQTWKAVAGPNGIRTMACSQADTCFGIASNCGAECDIGDVFLTTNGARTWKQVAHHPTGKSLESIICPSAATCYAYTSYEDRSVVRTTDGGKTWAVRRLSDPAASPQAISGTCPSPTTCYVPASFGVLKTSDGFDHTQETLAHSVIHDLSLSEISCASAASCYAAAPRHVTPGSGPGYDVAGRFVATSDGGRTWRPMPKTPDLLARLSCAGATVCYAIGESNGDSRELAVDRSGDGARTWRQTTWQQISPQLLSHNQSWDISCVAATTCYLLATISVTKGGTFGPPLVGALVTHDDGRTWSVQTGIDAAARAGDQAPTTQVTPSRISCPSVRTCFVLATVYRYIPPTSSSPGGSVEEVVVLSTADGGKTWTRHLPARDAAPSATIPWLREPLACPTTTTCYLLSYKPNPEQGNPNSVPGPVLVTHDAGATWRSSVVSPGAYFFSIACATAQACRVVGPTGIFGTDNGGTTWQRELLADGRPAPPMFSIACPAIDSCYAVGGTLIVATHSISELRQEVSL